MSAMAAYFWGYAFGMSRGYIHGVESARVNGCERAKHLNVGNWDSFKK